MASVVISGDTSGAITISAPAVAGTNTLTLPVATDTLVGKTTTDTLTNKTLTSPTLTTPALGTPASGILTSCTGVNYDGYKNRIINGGMVISQRNGTSTITPADNDYLTDRWSFGIAQASKLTATQSSTAPAGFTNSVLVTSSSAFTPGSTDLFRFTQKIEGFNTADLAFGTASASTVTLSFWVRSSLTGTFGGSLLNNDSNRSYPFTYTINAANTFEYKTVTIAGDTTGTWVGATNGIGLYVNFSLGAGSTRLGTAGAWAAAGYYGATGQTNLVATNGATFYITGVQLEKGSTATSFDYRPYGTELQLCQRYYENNYSTGYAVGSIESYPYNVGQFINGYTSSSGQKFQTANLLVQKRTAQPTVTFYDGAGNSGKISTLDAGGTSTNNVSIGVNFISDKYIAAGPSSGTMTGSRYFWVCSAEL